jgi:hypothetical protein
VPLQHLLEAGHFKLSVADDNPSIYDSVPGANRAAPEPGLHEISVGTREADPVDGPHYEVGRGALAQLTQLTLAAETGSRAHRGHVQHVPGVERLEAVS